MADLTAAQMKELAGSTLFTGRLQILLGQYAKAVKNGTVSSPSAASIGLADAVQLDPGRMSGLIAVSIVSDGTIKAAAVSGSGNTTDTAIGDYGSPSLDGIIQSIWNSGAWNRLI
jgi:hypothetical protein